MFLFKVFHACLLWALMLRQWQWQLWHDMRCLVDKECKTQRLQMVMPRENVPSKINKMGFNGLNVCVAHKINTLNPNPQYQEVGPLEWLGPEGRMLMNEIAPLWGGPRELSHRPSATCGHNKKSETRPPQRGPSPNPVGTWPSHSQPLTCEN